MAPSPHLEIETMAEPRTINKTLDFGHPALNPDGLLIHRNRKFIIDGLTVDKLELIVPLTDLRDALHTDGFLDPDLPGGPGIRIRKPKVTDGIHPDQSRRYAQRA